MSVAARSSVISASAGTGKTWRLTEEVVRALGGSEFPVDALLAVTYTRKAHAELASRLRRALVAAGRFTDAHRLGEALVGTVHSVCLRLLGEFAFQAGQPAEVNVIEGDSTPWLSEALESALPFELRDELERLTRKLQIEWDSQQHRPNWILPVTEIMTLARQNRIAPEHLPQMAARSFRGFSQLLAPAGEDGRRLEEEFENALRGAIDGLHGLAFTKATDDAVNHLLRIYRELRERPESMPWVEWLRAAHVKPAAAGAKMVEPLRQFSQRVLAHPTLRAELRGLIDALYQAARLGLEAYQEQKRDRRLVDYHDMIDGALRLIETSHDVQEELADRVRLVVVDEFQDTTPLQLAFFLRLHRLGARSVWVGDAKQCIFEYAGADPELLEAATAWNVRSGGATERLARNHRSRPELVRACSALFAAAFRRFRVTPEDVVVDPVRAADGPSPDLPPLGLWQFEKASQEWAAIADGISRLLSADSLHLVVDRATGALRPLRPGDIGVLVRTNEHAKRLAIALAERGLAASAAQDGLLSTPEGTVVRAALDWLLDDRDQVSAATLDAMFGFGGAPADAWLEARLRKEDPAPAAWRTALALVRTDLPDLSPAQVVNRVIGSLGLCERCARWPSPHQRLGNLDALRRVSARYEATCQSRRAPATLTGLVRFLAELRKKRPFRDGGAFVERSEDDQHVTADGAPDAVTISTYHRAKGLEWPVVVLASLDDKPREPLFDVQPESDRLELDPEAPLAGRWIRYWPCPFGRSSTSPLIPRARAADEGRRVLRSEAHERVRLLYVGFTRARDHLVLAARCGKEGPKARWLEEIGVTLPAVESDGPGILRLGGTDAQAILWRVGADRPRERRPPAPDSFCWPRPAVAAQISPYLLRPSSAEATEGARTLEVVRLETGIGARFHRGDAWDRVGDAIHRFLASDDQTLARATRSRRAAMLAAAYDVVPLLTAEAMVAESDAFRSFIDQRWPGARCRREVPISIEVGSPKKRINGTIDLLLELPDRRVVIDHKSFPADEESAWRRAAKQHFQQLSLYAQALSALPGPMPVDCWIHLPIGGAMVQLQVPLVS
jgi:ATP-dependent exoDNAse (exonuclease V) beta subunit